MAIKLLSLLFGSVVGTTVPLIDLGAYSRNLNYKIDTAGAILGEARQFALAESTEACIVDDLANRMHWILSTAWTSPIVFASELNVCSTTDQESVISKLKEIVIMESLMSLSNYRSLLTVHGGGFALHSQLQMHTQYLDGRTKLYLRFLGWLRNLRDDFAPACESVEIDEGLVRPLTARFVDMIIPIEHLSSTREVPTMLAIRERVRLFVEDSDSSAATIGHALRRAYATMIDRHNRWKREYLVVVQKREEPMRTQHTIVEQQISMVDSLTTHINSLLTK
jgi:hypothetical protein